MRKLKLLSLLFALVCATSMWAEQVITIQTNLGVEEYVSGDVTITCLDVGDGDGLYLASPAATVTISYSGSEVISQIELTPGFYESYHADVRANEAAPTSSSESSIVFENVNTKTVTLTTVNESGIQIKEVKVTIGAAASTTTVTWDFYRISNLDLSSGDTDTDANGITLRVNDGSILGVTFGGYNEGHSFTFSYANGNFKRIVITCEYANVESDGWTTSSPVTWEGNASSVDFGSDFDNVTSIVFTIEGGSEPEPSLQVTRITSDMCVGWASDNNPLTAEDLVGFQTSTLEDAQTWAFPMELEIADLIYTFNNGKTVFAEFADNEGGYDDTYEETITHAAMYNNIVNQSENWFYISNGETPTKVDIATARIDAIGTVVYTTSCKAKIDAARAAYNALSSSEKAEVTNASDLTDAEAAYSELAVNDVIGKINDIGTVAYTSACKTKIDAARTAYNALNGSQQAQVSNYSTLTAAETTYNAVDAVVALIDAIGTVTADSGDDIEAARSAYDALTAARKALVPAAKLAALVAAEDAYEAIVGNEISANYDAGTDAYYATFFNGLKKYALPNDGTEAYVAEVSGSTMYLHKIAEGAQVLPANTAVILIANSSSITLTPTTDDAVSFSETNSLEGVDAETAVSDVIAAGHTCYVLSGVDGVGFYKYTGETLGAHKAYLDRPSGSPAPRRMRFIFDQENAATSVENAEAAVKSEKRIENGQLIIIRGGEMFNAQGMIVK